MIIRYKFLRDIKRLYSTHCYNNALSLQSLEFNDETSPSMSKSKSCVSVSDNAFFSFSFFLRYYMYFLPLPAKHHTLPSMEEMFRYLRQNSVKLNIKAVM